MQATPVPAFWLFYPFFSPLLPIDPPGSMHPPWLIVPLGSWILNLSFDLESSLTYSATVSHVLTGSRSSTCCTNSEHMHLNWSLDELTHKQRDLQRHVIQYVCWVFVVCLFVCLFVVCCLLCVVRCVLFADCCLLCCEMQAEVDTPWMPSSGRATVRFVDDHDEQRQCRPASYTDF